jgi:hypothetical protein
MFRDGGTDRKMNMLLDWNSGRQTDIHVLRCMDKNKSETGSSIGKETDRQIDVYGWRDR